MSEQPKRPVPPFKETPGISWYWWLGVSAVVLLFLMFGPAGYWFFKFLLFVSMLGYLMSMWVKTDSSLIKLTSDTTLFVSAIPGIFWHDPGPVSYVIAPLTLMYFTGRTLDTEEVKEAIRQRKEQEDAALKQRHAEAKRINEEQIQKAREYRAPVQRTKSKYDNVANYFPSTGPNKVLEGTNSFVYGVAGANIAEAGFEQGLKDAGSAGERRLGWMLEQFGKKHQCVIFHGLQFAPGSIAGADVDHAILIGTKLVLIDAKNWKGGTYGFNPEDVVVRNTEGGDKLEEFSGGKVSMAEAARRWREYLGAFSESSGVEVLPPVVTVTRDPKSYRILNPFASNMVLATTEGLMERLERLATKRGFEVYEASNKGAVQTIVRCCQTMDADKKDPTTMR